MYAHFNWSHNFVRILWQTQCAPVPLGHTSTSLFEILLNERSWLYSFQKHFCGYTQWKHLFNTFTDIWTSAWYTGKTTLISNITSFGSSSPCVKFVSVFYSTLRSSHGHTLIVWQVTTWIFLLLLCQWRRDFFLSVTLQVQKCMSDSLQWSSAAGTTHSKLQLPLVQIHTLSHEHFTTQWKAVHSRTHIFILF